METIISAMKLDAPSTTSPFINQPCNGDSVLSNQVLRCDNGVVGSTELPPLHVEMALSYTNIEQSKVIEHLVVEFLRYLGPRHVPAVIRNFDTCHPSSPIPVQISNTLSESVTSIELLLDESDSLNSHEYSRFVDLRSIPLIVHVYQLLTGDEAVPVHETIQLESSNVVGGVIWPLPSSEVQGLWESLVFDSQVKLNLLNYAQTALLFADRQVSSSIISWNRVILLYGPPGTGKTSLCRALANKLAIRMSDRYSSAKLIELNAMNLLSKWFSESAKLVSHMFDAIRGYLESSDHLVCLLVDEVESLTAVRSSAMSGCEPSDAIRVVNSVLTHIDQIKRYPNCLIMTTSNVTGVIDPAFLDRADIRTYIGPPSAPAIYTIYRSCVDELIRVGLLMQPDNQLRLLTYRSIAAMNFVEDKVNWPSSALWRLAEASVGLNGRTLRKLPLLAYSFYLGAAGAGTSNRSCQQLDAASGRVHYPPGSISVDQPSVDAMALDDRLSTSNGFADSVDDESDQSCVGSGGVSFEVFVNALRCAVQAQFSDSRTLDEASVGISRLATNTVADYDRNGDGC